VHVIHRITFSSVANLLNVSFRCCRVGTPHIHSLLLYQTTDRQTKRDHRTGHECMHAIATAAGLQDQISLNGSVGRWTVR